MASPFAKLGRKGRERHVTTHERRDLHKRLFGVLGLVELVVPAASVVVHLVENSGKVYGEISGAVTTVGSSSTVRDVRFMVRRVDVLPVPAALEVLGDNNESNGLKGMCKLNLRAEHEHR